MQRLASFEKIIELSEVYRRYSHYYMLGIERWREKKK